MNLFNYKKNKGFSLIETLIAVSILMIAITGPLTLVQAGLFSSNHERNQITATYLAQEAMEFVRSIRDANSYYNVEHPTTSPPPTNDWLYDSLDGGNLLTLCGGANGCYVDPHKQLSGKYVEKIVSWPVGQRFLFQHNSIIDPTIMLNYDYSGSGNVTTFERTVYISSIAGTSDEVAVTVTVKWKDNLLQRSYSVTENLLNYEEDGN